VFSTKQLSSVQARTRAAILAATAAALAANRTATMPEIATVAGVGRTTLHRYFAGRCQLAGQRRRAARRLRAAVLDFEVPFDDTGRLCGGGRTV
jgi:AcrR family transcriptional regulator